jgi:hypothetical protein
MFTVLVVSLLTAIGAAFFYLNASGEIPRIMSLILVLICFLLDIVLAPWPIQFLILIVVLISTRNIALPNQHPLG